MADTSTDDLKNHVDNLKAHDAKSKNDQENAGSNNNPWGLPLEEVYKLSLRFYKENDGKALKLSYRDKLRLVALTKQASFGKYRADKSPEVGFLDVVGNDRRQAWQSLGEMTKDSAMNEFVNTLNTMSASFHPFVDAHKAEQEENARKRLEEEERKRKEEEEKQRLRLEEEAKRQLELEKKRQMEQELQIRTALNQQTAVQFSQYAQQQYPGDKRKQEELIRQLQDQHYQQYMQQVYQQQMMQQQQQYHIQNHDSLASRQAAQENSQNSNPEPPKESTTNSPKTTKPFSAPNGVQKGTQDIPNENESSTLPTSEQTADENLVDKIRPIAAASMWTRKDIKEFKQTLSKEKDAIIKVGSGETVTVRVPTHEDGTCLFWEFATDYYDIGFGVYFEWTIAPNNTVSVHISESSDEEEFDEEQEEKGGDIERGGSRKDDRPPTDEIIPVYRRDSHEEVYCGSHAYPGQGVYLLKFDNSYSLWRSKTLYYRVYYSR